MKTNPKIISVHETTGATFDQEEEEEDINGYLEEHKMWHERDLNVFKDDSLGSVTQKAHSPTKKFC